MRIIHMARGGDLTAECGQGVARPGHMGLHSTQGVAFMPSPAVACGHCHLVETEGRAPKHMADRLSSQAGLRNLEAELAAHHGFPQPEGKHAAWVAA